MSPQDIPPITPRLTLQNMPLAWQGADFPKPGWKQGSPLKLSAEAGLTGTFVQSAMTSTLLSGKSLIETHLSEAGGINTSSYYGAYVLSGMGKQDARQDHVAFKASGDLRLNAQGTHLLGNIGLNSQPKQSGGGYQYQENPQVAGGDRLVVDNAEYFHSQITYRDTFNEYAKRQFAGEAGKSLGHYAELGGLQMQTPVVSAGIGLKQSVPLSQNLAAYGIASLQGDMYRDGKISVNPSIAVGGTYQSPDERFQTTLFATAQTSRGSAVSGDGLSELVSHYARPMADAVAVAKDGNLSRLDAAEAIAKPLIDKNNPRYFQNVQNFSADALKGIDDGVRKQVQNAGLDFGLGGKASYQATPQVSVFAGLDAQWSGGKGGSHVEAPGTTPLNGIELPRDGIIDVVNHHGVSLSGTVGATFTIGGGGRHNATSCPKLKR